VQRLVKKQGKIGLCPAKHAVFGRPGNDLLTIPTYLWPQGERGAHIRGIALSDHVARAVWHVAIGVTMAAKAKQADAEVEDKPDEEGEAPAAAPKKKFALPSMKVMIIAAAGLLVVGGGGTAGYMFFFKTSGHEQAAKTETKAATFVDLPDVLVNLANAGTDRTQYLKVKIVLELPDAKLVGEIQPLMPRVMDAFQTYLRELRPTDLDGSAGLYRLKEELTRRVNAAVAPNRITAVLFKEIVVQ
jgi:flagellar FliL protein